MNIQTAFFIVILFVPAFVGNSYGQSSQTNTTFFIFVQTQVRNSDDKLVAYLEANKIAIPGPELLNKLLDSRIPSTTFTRSGQNFELIQLDVKRSITQSNVISKTALGTVVDGNSVLMAYSDHDGYPVVPGDTVTSVWTIIRPAR